MLLPKFANCFSIYRLNKLTTPSDAFTVAYHSTALVCIYSYTIVWECMCASLSLSLSLSLSVSLSFVVVVFLSFDGSETLIKINIIGFALHPTMLKKK